MERELHLCGYDGIGLADCVTAIAKQLGQECSNLLHFEGSDVSETFSEYSCALSNSNDTVSYSTDNLNSSNNIEKSNINIFLENLKYTRKWSATFSHLYTDNLFDFN